MNKNGIKRIISLPLILSCGISVILIMVNIFRWNIIDIVTVFVQLFIELIVYIAFLIIIIWSIFYWITNFKDKKMYAMIPLIINIITIISIMFIPFKDIMLKLDFETHYNERVSIVDMVKSGELRNDTAYRHDLIQLPEEFKHLSKGGGEISVYKDNNTTEILFYTFRGILDNFSGFVYAEDGKEPILEYYDIIISVC